MYNIDIRDAIKSNGLYGYQVAEMIGMTEFSFSRLLARKELSPERKQQIYDAIGVERKDNCNSVSNNKINLCGSCKCLYPDCSATINDLLFGDDVGDDNICACAKYEAGGQPKRSETRCPSCGGTLSEVRESKGKRYRHCYSCHFEFEEET